MQFRLALFTSGLLLVILGLSMLIPAMLDHSQGHANASAFYMSAILSLFIGGALFLTNKGEFERFNVKEGFILTTTSWLLLCLAGALPLYLSDLNITYTDAFFESVSGITTTGSTILSGLDTMSHGILVWRSMLQWIGGIGIIAFGMVLLPFLKIGGMQLFLTESSDRSDKILPQSRELVGRLLLTYTVLTILCFITYFFLGMTPFDAINHAMTTLSTGGYSTHDASFGFYDTKAMQLACTLFMFLGGLPFVLFVKAVFLGQFSFHKDNQVKTFTLLVLAACIVITASLAWNGDENIVDGIVISLFNIVSVVTTTGYATTDYTTYTPFITALFFFMTYLGGCAGSTAGGLKIMRLLIVFKGAKRQLHQLIFQRGVFVTKYQNKILDNSLITTVMAFLSLYVVLNVFLTIALTLTGLDIETAISGAATAIANVGPGVGDIIGPAGNFSSLPSSAKWLLSFGMFLGRLEILTVLVIFTPYFWRG